MLFRSGARPISGTTFRYLSYRVYMVERSRSASHREIEASGTYHHPKPQVEYAASNVWSIYAGSSSDSTPTDWTWLHRSRRWTSRNSIHPCAVHRHSTNEILRLLRVTFHVPFRKLVQKQRKFSSNTVRILPRILPVNKYIKFCPQ